MGVGCWVWVLEFGGLGFGVWGVWGLGFGVWGLGFGFRGLGFGVGALGFRVRVWGFRVWGSWDMSNAWVAVKELKVSCQHIGI